MSALLHLATFVLATHGGGGKGGGGEVVGGGKGVSSLLKDLGCGMANMAVPYFLTVPGYGVGRVMVDIGLHEGKEMGDMSAATRTDRFDDGVVVD